MRARTLLPVVLVALAALSLVGCATESPSSSTSDADGHGDVAGAVELAEPPLALVSIDAEGGVGLLDLLDGGEEMLNGVGKPLEVASDGRYVFVTTTQGLEIIDSGRWSWDHGDHFHYYLAEPRHLGVLEGEGDATVTAGTLSTAGSTGVFFAGSREAVLLDNAALADGEIVERFRRDASSADGMIALVGTGAVIADADTLVFYDESGAPTSTTIACEAASGSITTRAGAAVGCLDGAVLATWRAGEAALEKIPYSEERAVPPAVSFDARKGRPTVAAAAGGSGLWLLDVRERTWQFIASSTALARVAAVDDEAGHVVALDVDGRIRVFSATAGTEIAVTEPLIGDIGTSTSLTVDGQRAYLNGPGAGVVLEIDYADGARVARTLATPTTPVFVAEVGR